MNKYEFYRYKFSSKRTQMLLMINGMSFDYVQDVGNDTGSLITKNELLYKFGLYEYGKPSGERNIDLIEAFKMYQKHGHMKLLLPLQVSYIR